jgi:type II secretory pathway pseudopilin PulG
MKHAEGMTLIELMIVMTVLTTVLGLLFLLGDNLQRSVAAQEAKVSTQDSVRTGMQTAMRELRQAARGTVTWNTLPGASISYQRADDLDGNGTAVDSGLFLELGPQRTLQRDVDDVNSDGLTLTQLVVIDANTVQVVANGLLPNEDANGDGVLAASEDRNNNGVLDRGLWFEPMGDGIRVTLQSQRSLGPRNPLMTSQLVEIVVPRN